jgi:outer membrane protein assembly factor BamB
VLLAGPGFASFVTSIVVPFQTAAVVDPAPPVVHELAPMAAPEAKATPELSFHRAPAALAADAVVEDWPAFRGPRRDGHTRETRLAKTWPKEGPPLVWELVIGRGFASPVVADGRLVLTHREGDEIHVDCLEPESGRRFWRHTWPCEYKDRYISNDGPRSTPTIADGRVYVHGLEGQLACLELATGRVVWERSTKKDFELPGDFFGVVASPLAVDVSTAVGDAKLLIQNLGAPGPCVAAFERASGKLVWGAGPKWGPSCASPVLGRIGGRERLFVLAGGESRPPTGGLVVLDPASGRVEHEYPFRSKTYESVTGSSPVVAGERVFLSASYGTGSACLEANTEVGEGGAFKELWKNRHIGLQFSSAIFEAGVLYLVDGVADRAGALVALDPATGEELARTELGWDETVKKDGSEATRSFTVGEGSLLWADGSLLCLGDNGHLLWLDASSKGARVLARAWLFGANESWTPPVVAHGLLYVRQTKPERFGASPPRLLCYDLRARAP